MQYHCKKGMHHEWIEAMTPAHAAQEYHYHTATARDKHVLDNGDGKLTVYGQVEVVGHSVWICRTHLRPLRRRGGVVSAKPSGKTLADIEADMGLAPGYLSGMKWELEEEVWR